MKHKVKQLLKCVTVFLMILTLLITTETIVLAEELKEQAEEAVREYQEEKRTQEIQDAQQEYLEENQAAPAETRNETVSAGGAEGAQRQAGQEEVVLSQPELESDLPDLYEQLYGEPVEVYEYGKVYRTDTSTYRFIGTSEPFLYADETGELKEIDNTLIKEQTPGLRLFLADAADTTYYTNNEGANDVKLPARMQDGRGLTITNKDGKSLELFPDEGTYENASVLHNAILYNEVFEHVDVQYTIKGNSIKEDIILREPGDKHSFSYRFSRDQFTATLQNNVVSVMTRNTAEADPVRQAPTLPATA